MTYAGVVIVEAHEQAGNGIGRFLPQQSRDPGASNRWIVMQHCCDRQTLVCLKVEGQGVDRSGVERVGGIRRDR